MKVEECLVLSEPILPIPMLYLRLVAILICVCLVFLLSFHDRITIMGSWEPSSSSSPLSSHNSLLNSHHLCYYSLDCGSA
jgi:hypothetical protein